MNALPQFTITIGISTRSVSRCVIRSESEMR